MSRIEQTFDDSDSVDSQVQVVEDDDDLYKSDVNTLKAVQLGLTKKVGQLKDQIE